MERKYLRILAMALVSVMLMGLLLGCGSASNQQGTVGTKSTAEKGKKLEEYTDPIKWSVYMCSAGAGAPANPTATQEHKYFMDKFKIDIYSDAYWGGADYDQKLNLAIASNELPDIMTEWTHSKALLDKMADAGMLLEVEPYLKYMPNYMQYTAGGVLDINRDLKDNKLYYVPTGTIPVGNVKTEIPSGGFAYNGFTYNDAIFKQLNLQVPTTPDELYKVLVAIKNANLKTKDGKTVVPLGAAMGAPETAPSLKYRIAGAFGLYTNKLVVNEAEKRMVSETEKPEYLQYLKFMSKLYRERLIYNDYLTASYADLDARIKSGEYAMVLNGVGNIDGQNAQLAKNGLGQQIPMPQFVAPGIDVNKTNIEDVNIGGYCATAINKNIKDPERLFKFLDFLATKEGTIVYYYGPPNKDSKKGMWYKDDNGKTVFHKDRNYLTEDFNKVESNEGGFSQNLMLIAGFSEDPKFSSFDDDWIAQKGTESWFLKMCLANKATLDYDPKWSLYKMLPDGDVRKTKSAALAQIQIQTEQKIIITAKSDSEVETMYQTMMNDLNQAGLKEVEKEDYNIKYLKEQELMK